MIIAVSSSNCVPWLGKDGTDRLNVVQTKTNEEEKRS